MRSSGRRGLPRLHTCGRCWHAPPDWDARRASCPAARPRFTSSDSGKGGRNQEFALASADLLTTTGGAAVVASVGTDGIDGPTDAAGALADSTTIDRAAAAGLVPGRFLSDNNAYAFFEALGDLIHTGPTGTNVGDLQVILLA